MKTLVYTWLALTFLSCSNECITCTNSVEMFEFCDEEDAVIIDSNGIDIPFEDVAEKWGEVGYTCN